MEKLFTVAMDIGEQMLVSGAEVHRAEDSIKRICSHFGAARTDVFVITSSMVVTVYMPDGKILTQTRRILSTGTDLEKLHNLNELSRRICCSDMTADEIKAEYEKAIGCKHYPKLLENFAYGIIAAMFTLFFGGILPDAAVSFVVGFFVRFTIVRLPHSGNRLFPAFLSSLIATALTVTAHALGIVTSVDMVLIGNIMPLIPGIGLTNSFRDLFVGDSIAAILRMTEALLTALAIAAGYIIVVLIGGAVL